MARRMLNVYTSRGASLHQINSLAEWVREHVAQVKDGNLDVIKFVEIDLQSIFPGLYVEILSDEDMGCRRAAISSDPLGIIVSESIYEGAANGCMFSSEVILHEVGHLFLHHKFQRIGLNNASSEHYEDQFLNTNNANSAEWQATSFAMCLLYPYSKIRNRDLDNIQTDFRVTKKQAFRISSHMNRLRLRETSRDENLEARWILATLKALPKKERQYQPGDQLNLFFSSGKNGNAFDGMPHPNGASARQLSATP
jgi:IrrE N-terminal-like domain